VIDLRITVVALPEWLWCLFQVKNLSLPIYKRVTDIQDDHDKHFFTFSNEFCRYIYCAFLYYQHLNNNNNSEIAF